MKLDLKVVPDLATLMAEEIEAAERAVTTGVGEVGVRLKGNWRAQVVGAGLGPRLGNTIRSERYPKQGTSIRAAALVWSKAPGMTFYPASARMSSIRASMVSGSSWSSARLIPSVS